MIMNFQRTNAITNLCQVLNLLELLHIILGDDGHRAATPARSSGTANSVHVVFAILLNEG